MLNITHYQRNAIQNHNEVPFHASQNGCDPKSTSNECWNCWWECKLVQTLWRTVWRFLKKFEIELPSVQFISVAQSCPTLWDPMNRSTPGLPVHHQLPEFIQTHVHWVSDAIQPSHPLSSHSTPAPNPSKHQSLFQWVNSSHEVAKVLEFQLQHHSLQRNPRLISFRWTGWISLQSKGLSRVFSNNTVQKYQFFGTQLSSQSNSHIHSWPQEKPSPWLDGPLLEK